VPCCYSIRTHRHCRGQYCTHSSDPICVIITTQFSCRVSPPPPVVRIAEHQIPERPWQLAQATPDAAAATAVPHSPLPSSAAPAAPLRSMLSRTCRAKPARTCSRCARRSLPLALHVRPWIDLDEDATTAGMLCGIASVASDRAQLSRCRTVAGHLCAGASVVPVRGQQGARRARVGQALVLIFVAVGSCTFAAVLVAAGRAFSADETDCAAQRPRIRICMRICIYICN
jgi:hypothetical protein